MIPQIIQKHVITEEDIDYLHEGFLRMSSRQTNIPVDIFVNEDNMREYTKFPLVVLFRNDYYSDARNYMPMTVSENPILLSDKPINISEEDVHRIAKWVIKYRDLLVALSEEEIYNFEFLDEYNYHIDSPNKILNYKPKYKVYET